MDKQTLLNLIFECYAEVKKKSPEILKEQLSGNTPLVGDSSELDSVDLINLVMTIEKKMKAKYQYSIKLMGQKLLAKKRDPFEKIETLAEYLQELVSETVSP